MNPRQGPLSRIHHIRESTWGSDPVTPNAYLIPFMNDGFALSQPRARGVFYDGNASSKGSFRQKISCGGPMDTSIDFDYMGIDLMDVFGSSGYSRVGTLHRWTSLGNPLPHQIRKEFTQATAIIHRYPGVIAQSMKFGVASQGQAMYTVQRLGKGGEALADIASTTLLDTTTKKVNSYYNGSLTQDGSLLGNTAVFDLTVDRSVSGKDGVFFGGQLAAYSIGIPKISGNLGKIFSTDDGDAFYNLAVNETDSGISCLWGNLPLSTGPTKFFRIFMDACLFDRNAPAAGGDTIPDQTQPYIAELPATGVYHAARAFGTLVGPFSLGSSVVVSVKFQGGSTINVTVANGTAASIAATLNADSTFTAAGIANDLNGRLEIVSRDTTSASSVQWQTGTTNSAHSILGFTNTTWSGYPPSEIYAELFNGTSSDFA